MQPDSTASLSRAVAPWSPAKMGQNTLRRMLASTSLRGTGFVPSVTVQTPCERGHKGKEAAVERGGEEGSGSGLCWAGRPERFSSQQSPHPHWSPPTRHP